MTGRCTELEAGDPASNFAFGCDYKVHRELEIL